jgi:hypothetical protein
VRHRTFTTYYRAVTTVYAAVYASSEEAARHAGVLIARVGIPLIGLICLVIGLWDRSRNRRQSRPGYPYPPGPPPPPVGYPGAYPPPAYPGYPPGWPPQQRAAKSSGKSATVLITIGAVVLAFGILGNLTRALTALGKSAAASENSMRVGECIDQTAYSKRSFSSTSGSDCGNPANTYVLAAKGDAAGTCPDGKRDGSIYDRFTNNASILCFALNLKEDQCYEVGPDRDHPTMSLSNCGEARSRQIKVVQRIDGSTDNSQCPPGVKGISYPTPAVVYCLEKVSP